jgi:hypothetical protein
MTNRNVSSGDRSDSIDTRSTTTLFLFVGVVYLVASTLVCGLLLRNEGWVLSWLGAQTIAIFLAGAIYLWYTYETKLLRRYAAAQHHAALNQLDASHRQIDLALRQFEVSTRPLVVALRTERADQVVVRNDGNSPAINIRVTATLDESDIGPHISIILKYRETALAAHDTGSITMREEDAKGREAERSFVLVPGSTNRVVRLLIDYQDTDMRKYRTHVLVSNEGYEIKRFEFPTEA